MVIFVKKIMAALLVLPTIALAQITDIERNAINELLQKPIAGKLDAGRYIASRRDYAVTKPFSDQEAQIIEQVDDKAREVVNELERVLQDRIAGIWVEYDDYQTYIIYLTGNDAVTGWGDSFIIDDAVQVKFKYGAQYTQRELLRFDAIISSGIEYKIPGLQSTDINIKQNKIIYQVHDADTDSSTIERSIKSHMHQKSGRFNLNKNDDYPLEVKEIKKPITEVNQADIIRGGSYMNGCTSGFIAAYPFNATYSFYTAGHCSGGQYLKDPQTGRVYNVRPFVKFWDGTRDMQGYEIPSVNVHLVNEFFYLKKATTRPARFFEVEKVIKRPQQRVGYRVCHFGKGSNYSCGKIESTTYKPNSPALCNYYPCQPVFVKVIPDWDNDLKCSDGDSGGPVFAYRTEAYGLWKGAGLNSNGSCAYGMYQSLDPIYDLDLVVMDCNPYKKECPWDR